MPGRAIEWSTGRRTNGQEICRDQITTGLAREPRRYPPPSRRIASHCLPHPHTPSQRTIARQILSFGRFLHLDITLLGSVYRWFKRAKHYTYSLYQFVPSSDILVDENHSVRICFLLSAFSFPLSLSLLTTTERWWCLYLLKILTLLCVSNICSTFLDSCVFVFFCFYDTW